MPVQPQAPANPKLAILLEAPGTEDLNKGRPFAGNTGSLFRQICRVAGIEYDDLWIGYVFDEKPTDKWFAKLTEARAGGFDDMDVSERGFLRPEHRHHLDRLAGQLADLDCNVIVPLGNMPFWALTGRKTMDKYRGAAQAATLVKPGQKILPTLHPGLVRVAWKNFPVVVRDLQKAMREAAAGPALNPPRVELTVLPDLDEVKEWFAKHLPSAQKLSVDIETGWGQITSIGFAVNASVGICIPIVDLDKPDRSYWSEADEIEIWGIIKQVMEGSIPKLGQNFAQYDLIWLWQRYGIETRNLTDDTRLMSHAIYPEMEKSLAFLASAFTDFGPWKGMVSHHVSAERDAT